MSRQLNRLDNSRKRQRTEQHSRQAKRTELNGQSIERHSSSAFWDELSKIWLTKYALRELDRRNSELVAQSTSRQVARSVTRPITRNFLADLRKGRRPAHTADELHHNYTSEALKDIKLFARRGGPNLSDLRGYPEPVNSTSLICTMSSSRSSGRSRGRTQGSSSGGRTKTTATNTTATKGSKNSRPKDLNYRQKLIDGHSYPYGYKYPGDNRPPFPPEWAEFNQRLARPRPSLSPSTFPEEDYQRFVEEDASAVNEDAVKDSVVPAMLKAMGASGGAQKNIWFTNTDPITTGISKPKPDYYYGAPPEQIHERVREDLSRHIIPSTQTDLPAVPNFSMEAKGPLGTNREALLQACHNGAIGARAMHSLQNYQQVDTVYDGRVSSISSTYSGGQLKMYGHSVTQPNGPGTQPHYHMHQLRNIGMTDSAETFRQGATAFKNARDLTEAYRNAAIARANGIAIARTAGDEEHEEDKEDEEDDDEEDEIGTDAMLSFAAGTSNSIPSTLVESEDEEEDPGDSETSVERHPPRKKHKSSSKKSGSKKSSGKEKAWYSFGF